MKLNITKQKVEIVLTERDMELLNAGKPVSLMGIEANDSRELIITQFRGRIEGKVKDYQRDAKAIKELTGQDPVPNFKGFNPKTMIRDFNPTGPKPKPFGLKGKGDDNEVEHK